jgi:3-dehydroquinate synthetase
LPKNFPRQKIVEALKFDKKFENEKVRFVVTPRIGAAHTATNVTMEDIQEAIEAL